MESVKIRLFVGDSKHVENQVSCVTLRLAGTRPRRLLGTPRTPNPNMWLLDLPEDVLDAIVSHLKHEDQHLWAVAATSCRLRASAVRVLPMVNGNRRCAFSSLFTSISRLEWALVNGGMVQRMLLVPGFRGCNFEDGSSTGEPVHTTTGPYALNCFSVDCAHRYGSVELMDVVHPGWRNCSRTAALLGHHGRTDLLNACTAAKVHNRAFVCQGDNLHTILQRMADREVRPLGRTSAHRDASLLFEGYITPAAMRLEWSRFWWINCILHGKVCAARQGTDEGVRSEERPTMATHYFAPCNNTIDDGALCNRVVHAVMYGQYGRGDDCSYFIRQLFTHIPSLALSYKERNSADCTLRSLVQISLLWSMFACFPRASVIARSTAVDCARRLRCTFNFDEFCRTSVAKRGTRAVDTMRNLVIIPNSAAAVDWIIEQHVEPGGFFYNAPGSVGSLHICERLLAWMGTEITQVAWDSRPISYKHMCTTILLQWLKRAPLSPNDETTNLVIFEFSRASPQTVQWTFNSALNELMGVGVDRGDSMLAERRVAVIRQLMSR